ncbi:MAG: S8 family serine peptidase [Alphaproteobacteria bacterium]|nr:S8 family serine peptidase [Alphaproteobacteria bacterium]
MSAFISCAIMIAPAVAAQNKCSNDMYRLSNPEKCSNTNHLSFATSTTVAGGGLVLIGGALALFSSTSSSNSTATPSKATTTRTSYDEVGNDIDYSRYASAIGQNSYTRNAVQYDEIRLGYSLARGYTGKNSTIAVFDSGIDTPHGNAVVHIATDQVAPDAKVELYEVSDSKDKFKSFYEIGNIISSAQGANIYNFSWADTSSFANEVYSRSQFEYMTDPHFVESLTQAATQHDAIFVWAAGNEYNYQSSSLSAMPRVIPELKGHFVNVVAWDSETQSLATFSNACGVTMNYCITAPGTDLKSSQSNKDLNGTSFAAPIVSAAIAVIREAFPYMKSSEITNLLFTTARDLGDIGVDKIYGHGMLDMERATRPVGATTVPLADGSNIAMQNSRLGSTIGNQIKARNIKLSFVDSFGRAFETNLNDNITIKNRGIGFERLKDNNINNVKIGNIEIGFKQTDMLNASGILQTKSHDILSFIGFQDKINLGQITLSYRTTFGTMNPETTPESIISDFSSIYTASANIAIQYKDFSFSVGTPNTIIGGDMQLHTLSSRNANGDYVFSDHTIDMVSTPSIEYSASYKSVTMGFVDNPYGTDEFYILTKTNIRF